MGFTLGGFLSDVFGSKREGSDGGTKGLQTATQQQQADAQAKIDQLYAPSQRLIDREAANYQQGQQLVGQLQQTAAGGGPSVVGSQVSANLDQIQRDAANAAAGARGGGGVLARYGAMQAGSDAAAKAAQAGAIARAAEITNAQKTLGGMIANQGNQTGSFLGTTLGGVTGLTNNVTGLNGQLLKSQDDLEKENADNNQKNGEFALGGFLSGSGSASSLFSGGSGAGGGAGAAALAA